MVAIRAQSTKANILKVDVRFQQHLHSGEFNIGMRHGCDILRAWNRLIEHMDRR